MPLPSLPDVPERTVVGLLVPADPDRPLGLHLLPDASVALSDALGGGFLAEPEVWLLGAGDDVRRVHVYRRERPPDPASPDPAGLAPGAGIPDDGTDPARRHPAAPRGRDDVPNRRLAALADLLDVPPRPVPPDDALLLGGRADGGDTDVPTVVLATALHSGWPVEMDVSASGDREAGEPRW